MEIGIFKLAKIKLVCITYELFSIIYELFNRFYDDLPITLLKLTEWIISYQVF